MHVIATDTDVINLDYFPVFVRQDSSLVFGYEDDFNTPITLNFPSPDVAQQNLVSIVEALAAGDKVVELKGVIKE